MQLISAIALTAAGLSLVLGFSMLFLVLVNGARSLLNWSAAIFVTGICIWSTGALILRLAPFIPLDIGIAFLILAQGMILATAGFAIFILIAAGQHGRNRGQIAIAVITLVTAAASIVLWRGNFLEAVWLDPEGIAHFSLRPAGLVFYGVMFSYAIPCVPLSFFYHKKIGMAIPIGSLILAGGLLNLLVPATRGLPIPIVCAAICGLLFTYSLLSKNLFQPLRQANVRLANKIKALLRAQNLLSASEEETKLALHAAEKANQTKGEFFANMSHELRTPLNAILGFAQIMELSYVDPPSGAQVDGLAHIRRAGEHLLSLINGLLDIARFEAEGTAIALKPVSIAEVFENVAMIIRPLAQANKLSIVLCDSEVSPDAKTSYCAENRYVLANKDALHRVVLNLAANAVKYSTPGGEVKFACSTYESRIRLTVRDKGVGIPSARHSDLFRRFERLEADQTAVQGSGIGLAISKQLADLMGGEIGFSSEVGSGSTFWIDLPPAPRPVADAAQPSPVLPASAKLAAPAMHGAVLYIEDDAVNSVLMEHVFQSMPDIKLILAETAEEALTKLETFTPDLILSDMNLPGISGLEFFKRAQLDPRLQKIPVVAVSAVALTEEIQRALDAGFYSYITKPFRVMDIFALVAKILSEK